LILYYNAIYEKNIFKGIAYFNDASTSELPGAQSDQCYYNIDESKRRPKTAISVEELPDIVLQSEFRAVLDEQFNVSGKYIYIASLECQTVLLA